MRTLCLYAQSQTYTSTVFEHVDAFREYSRHEWHYLDFRQLVHPTLDLNQFDVVVVHYSVRLPYDQIDGRGADKLSAYEGLKVLFIQDEYDRTNHAKALIRKIGFNLVFTVVPTQSLACVYPPAEFPEVVFASNLTGYVPSNLVEQIGAPVPPSQRSVVIGYRGRPLPVRYGQLGQEKVRIGRLVKRYCNSRGIANDIAWSERARIYGTQWYEFIASCRAMLGTESGSNVFDWDGTLDSRIKVFKRSNLFAGDARTYTHIVASQEQPGLMNQVSPRLFEAVAARTVLVLFEGSYSGVFTADKHYIELKKDGSNLDEVFSRLHDGDYVDRMAQQAYEDLIGSGEYSYECFVRRVDDMIDAVWTARYAGAVSAVIPRQVVAPSESYTLSRAPVRAQAPRVPTFAFVLGSRILRVLYLAWDFIPDSQKQLFRPILRKFSTKK